MRIAVVLVALLAVVSVANANQLVNGDFSAGETGWTQWRAPWGASETWGTAGNTGNLAGGGGNGSYGWFQVVAIPAGMVATVSADWAGNLGGAGWGEVMLFTRAAVEDWGFLADTGAAGDIAFKKDSWGMNPPTTWAWESAALSPHPSGNGGAVLSAGYVGVALKLGGFPMGNVSFDNIVLTPEPASLLLLGIPLVFIRRRRA